MSNLNYMDNLHMQSRPVWDGVILSHYGVPIISHNDVVQFYLKGHHSPISSYIVGLAKLVRVGEGGNLIKTIPDLCFRK